MYNIIVNYRIQCGIAESSLIFLTCDPVTNDYCAMNRLSIRQRFLELIAFFMSQSGLPLELSSHEITTIVNSLLASTHLCSGSESECFGLVFKLQAALATHLDTGSVTVNITQSLPGYSEVRININFIVSSL